MRTADTSTQLVQLRQAKFIGTLNNNGVGAGNIDTGFNNRGTNQDVEAFMIKINHHLFELPLAHCHAQRRYWSFLRALYSLPANATSQRVARSTEGESPWR